MARVHIPFKTVLDMQTKFVIQIRVIKAMRLCIYINLNYTWRKKAKK